MLDQRLFQLTIASGEMAIEMIGKSLFERGPSASPIRAQNWAIGVTPTGAIRIKDISGAARDHDTLYSAAALAQRAYAQSLRDKADKIDAEADQAAS